MRIGYYRPHPKSNCRKVVETYCAESLPWAATRDKGLVRITPIPNFICPFSGQSYWASQPWISPLSPHC